MLAFVLLTATSFDAGIITCLATVLVALLRNEDDLSEALDVPVWALIAGAMVGYIGAGPIWTLWCIPNGRHRLVPSDGVRREAVGRRKENQCPSKEIIPLLNLIFRRSSP